MSRVTVQVNTPQIWIVNNGTARNFTINADGTVIAQNSISIQYYGQTYKGTFTTSTITGSDKVYNFPNRSGNVALEDSSSLNSMLPSQSSNGGKFLYTDGTNSSWQSVSGSSLSTLNGISCATYNAQTLAIGTSGTSPNWVSTNSNTTTHTLNIPLASTTGVTAGLFSKADYDRIGFKDSANTWSVAQVFTYAPTITTPSTSTNAVATYGQLLAVKAGLAGRDPVDLLDTVSSGSSLAGVSTIDGTTVTLGMRVLATALSSGAGCVYKCSGISPTTWTLETDGQKGDGTPGDGDILFVKSGTNYHDQQWAYNGTSWILYNVAQSWTFSTGLLVTGTTVTVNFGTTTGTACQGNDSRLSDARTPINHSLDSAYHAISGKTAGQVVIATSANAFAFVTLSGDISAIDESGKVTISKINNVAISDLGIQQNSATLADNTSSNTLVTGCSFAIASYRSAKIEFSLTRGSGNISVGTIYLMHDGTNGYITLEEDLWIGANGITFAVDINSGYLRLLYTSTSTGYAGAFKFTTKLYPI